MSYQLALFRPQWLQWLLLALVSEIIILLTDQQLRSCRTNLQKHYFSTNSTVLRADHDFSAHPEPFSSEPISDAWKLFLLRDPSIFIAFPQMYSQFIFGERLGLPGTYSCHQRSRASRATRGSGHSAALPDSWKSFLINPIW